MFKNIEVFFFFLNGLSNFPMYSKDFGNSISVNSQLPGPHRICKTYSMIVLFCCASAFRLGVVLRAHALRCMSYWRESKSRHRSTDRPAPSAARAIFTCRRNVRKTIFMMELFCAYYFYWLSCHVSCTLLVALQIVIAISAGPPPFGSSWVKRYCTFVKEQKILHMKTFDQRSGGKLVSSHHTWHASLDNGMFRIILMYCWSAVHRMFCILSGWDGLCYNEVLCPQNHRHTWQEVLPRHRDHRSVCWPCLWL